MIAKLRLAALLALRGREAYFDKRWSDKTFGRHKEKMINKVHEYWKQNYSQNSLSTTQLRAADNNDDRSPLDLRIGDVSNQPNLYDDPFLNYIHSTPTSKVNVLN